MGVSGWRLRHNFDGSLPSVCQDCGCTWEVGLWIEVAVEWKGWVRWRYMMFWCGLFFISRCFMCHVFFIQVKTRENWRILNRRGAGPFFFFVCFLGKCGLKIFRLQNLWRWNHCCGTRTPDHLCRPHIVHDPSCFSVWTSISWIKWCSYYPISLLLAVYPTQMFSLWSGIRSVFFFLFFFLFWALDSFLLLFKGLFFVWKLQFKCPKYF